MHTIVYVDGLNLYHGLLQQYPGRSQQHNLYWVDIKKLCQKILPKECNIIKIKHFTAPLCNHSGKTKIEDAHNFHFFALKAFYNPKEFELFLGRFNEYETSFRDKSTGKFKKFYRLEEKHTDVNIATHILNDAWLDAYDCAFIISNDSDLYEALKLVKENKKNRNKKIFIATPTPKPIHPKKKVKTSSLLRNKSDRVFRIEKKHLGQCQLPTMIKTAHFDPAFCKNINDADNVRLDSLLQQPTISKPFASW